MMQFTLLAKKKRKKKINFNEHCLIQVKILIYSSKLIDYQHSDKLLVGQICLFVLSFILAVTQQIMKLLIELASKTSCSIFKCLFWRHFLTYSIKIDRF